MKDIKNFWTFVFGIGVLLLGMLIFFPPERSDRMEVSATAQDLFQDSLEDDFYKIKQQLPPARYYVQDLRLEYLPDGTFRDLHLQLISQQSQKRKQTTVRIRYAPRTNTYEIVTGHLAQPVQTGDLIFEELPDYLSTWVLKGMLPEEPCAYVMVQSSPLQMITLDPGDQETYYAFVSSLLELYYGMKPQKVRTGKGYLFNVFAMQKQSEGSSSGENPRRFLLGFRQ
jgi:hypothetical protein